MFKDDLYEQIKFYLDYNQDLYEWSDRIRFKNAHRIASFIHKGLLFDLYRNHYRCIVTLISTNQTVLKFKDIYTAVSWIN